MSEKETAIAHLLYPISKSKPCGEWIRYEPEFQGLSFDREEENPNLPMGEWERPLKKVDWAKIKARCENLIKSKSKDLLLVIWFCDASIRLKGLNGLLNGVTLFNDLVNCYWDSIWPEYDNTDSEARLIHLSWLNSKVLEVLRNNLVLLPLNEIREENIYFRDWEFHKNSHRSTVSDDKPSREKIRKQVLESDAFHLSMLMENSKKIIVIIEKFEKKLDSLLGADAPSFSKLTEFIGSVDKASIQLQGDINRKFKKPELSYVNEKKESFQVEKKEDFKEPESNKEESVSKYVTKAAGTYNSREEAYQAISSIAKYLENIEPHSPTPYLLRRAVKWGNMSLEELTQDIGKYDGSLEGLLSAIGSRKEKSG